jgi:hypothetical protein
MDWTTNPLVALYFSARSTKRNDQNQPLDSAVYVLTSEPARYSDFEGADEDAIQPVRDTFTAKATLVDLDQIEMHRDADNSDDAYEEWLRGENDSEPEFPDDSDSDFIANFLDELSSESELEDLQSQDVVARRPASTFHRLSPFKISENVIYDPPHVSPRIRAQDGVLMACYRPMDSLEEKDYLEIVIKHEAHDEIRRRLDQYGVFDKQLFPDLDGIAKWLKYRVFEIDGKC